MINNKFPELSQWYILEIKTDWEKNPELSERNLKISRIVNILKINKNNFY